MENSVLVLRSSNTRVATGGVPVVAFVGALYGGRITNPASSIDQGIAHLELLFVDIVNTAGLQATSTTVALQPGQSFDVPPNQTTPVSVNAATSGHRFSAVLFSKQSIFPPAPVPGNFPPSAPTGLTQVIPSYLYEEYADDDDLQAFVQSMNIMSQQYVDWFNSIGLPIYTGEAINGALLDWIAQGLYGIARPALYSYENKNVGAFNTYTLNLFTFNQARKVGNQNVVATSDDVFKRIITWNFFKGDGRVFTVRWLKRRIMRFLYGVDGVNFNVDQTYPISVTFGADDEVNINLGETQRTIVSGAVFNRFLPNTTAFNSVRSVATTQTPPPNAKILKEALYTGALQLPFGTVFNVNIPA